MAVYYPVLRGKQNELLAIRDLYRNNPDIFKFIHPVIEPIAWTSPQLKGLLDGKWISEDNPLQFYVIQNSELSRSEDDLVMDSIQSTFVAEKMDQGIPSSKNEGMIVATKEHDVNTENTKRIGDRPELLLMLDKGLLFNALALENRKIFLQDSFVKQPRNADYTEKQETFSNAHQLITTMKSMNVVGFSDYSVIGSEYVDSGFAPVDVAIHIVYFDLDTRELMIRHFVSDHNDSIEDVAGKFEEAVNKLANWWEMESQNPEFRNRNHSQGLTSFLNLAKSGKYSGLGIVKKFSIMHHLEIMGRYLQENGGE